MILTSKGAAGITGAGLTDRALRGEDLHAEEPRFDGRFEREEPQVVLPGR